MKPAIIAAAALTIASGAASGARAVSDQPARSQPRPPALPDFSAAEPLPPAPRRLLEPVGAPDPDNGLKLAAPLDPTQRVPPRAAEPRLYDAPTLPYPSRQPQTPQEAEEFMEQYRRRTYRSLPVYIIPLSGEGK